jgi:hypothetical protein
LICSDAFQILAAVMSGAFGLAGFYFGRKPTSATSEAEISVANSSMPWQVDHDHDDHSKHFKYQYHPKGDRSQAPRNAPSALNTVVIPNVTLPKVGRLRILMTKSGTKVDLGTSRHIQQMGQRRLLRQL